VLLKFLQEEQLSEKLIWGYFTIFDVKFKNTSLLFLEYILDAFKKFNAFFQTEETKVHLFQSDAKIF